MSYILKDAYEISVWEDELIPQSINENGEKVQEYFQEKKIAVIGGNDVTSRFSAHTPTLTKNINGTITLTFQLFYYCFDEDEGIEGEYRRNPFISLLTNERKIKLKFRDKWYDFLIKSCVEDSTKHSYTYTARSLYVNELSKNGFKVEVDEKLENNQGTNLELAKIILEDTDWLVDEENSDLLVETNIEPIFKGILSQDISVRMLGNYLPDPYAGKEEDKILTTIKAGEEVFFFYSDLVDNNIHPHILYRSKDKQEDGSFEYIYTTDLNNDIITNAYNFIVLDEVTYSDKDTENLNVPDIIIYNLNEDFELVNNYRGQKVVRSPLSAYDPDIDQFVTKFVSLDEEDETIYYGYEKTENYSPYLAQNFLANSENITTVEAGWVFDGTPTSMDDAGQGTVIDSEDATFTGKIYLLNEENFEKNATAEAAPRSVLVLNLKDGESMYPSATGEYLKFTKRDGDKNEVQYIEYTSDIAEDIKSDLLAIAKSDRENGKEDYANKTDEELEAIVSNALSQMRYSKRQHKAINTGVAANRKTIKTFTAGEQYVFAISLGRYEEGETPPLYYTELNDNTDSNSKINFGAQVPTEAYDFISEDEAEKGAAILAKEKIDTDILNNPNKYIIDEWLSSGENYSKLWQSIYNAYYDAYLETYLEENTFLGISLKKKQKEVLKNAWQTGGYKYRKAFNETLYKALLNQIKEKENGSVVKWSDFFEEEFNASLEADLNYFQEYKNFTADFEKEFGISYEEAENTVDEQADSKWFLAKWTVWKKMGDSSQELKGYVPTFEEKDGTYQLTENGEIIVNKPTKENYYNIEYNSYSKELKNRILKELENTFGNTFEKNDGTISNEEWPQLLKCIEEVNNKLSKEVSRNYLSYKNAFDLPGILNQNGGIEYERLSNNWEKEATRIADLVAQEKSKDAFKTGGWKYLLGLRFLRQQTEVELRQNLIDANISDSSWNFIDGKNYLTALNQRLDWTKADKTITGEGRQPIQETEQGQITVPAQYYVGYDNWVRSPDTAGPRTENATGSDMVCRLWKEGIPRPDGKDENTYEGNQYIDDNVTPNDWAISGYKYIEEFEKIYEEIYNVEARGASYVLDKENFLVCDKSEATHYAVPVEDGQGTHIVEIKREEIIKNIFSNGETHSVEELLQIIKNLGLNIEDFRLQFKKNFYSIFDENFPTIVDDSPEWTFIKNYVNNHQSYIRLIEAKDSEKNLYIPQIKNSGEYVEEVSTNYGITSNINEADFNLIYRLDKEGLGYYRPFKNKEILDDGSINYNDVQHFEPVLFDGHFGAYDVYPERYSFAKTLEDKNSRKYLILEPEDPYYEELNGVQLTTIISDDKGKYIYAGDVKKTYDVGELNSSEQAGFNLLFGENGLFSKVKLFKREEEVNEITEPETGGIISGVKKLIIGIGNFISGTFETTKQIFNREYSGISQRDNINYYLRKTLGSYFKNTSEISTIFNHKITGTINDVVNYSGTDSSNIQYKNEQNYVENQISFIMKHQNKPSIENEAIVTDENGRKTFTGVVFPTWYFEREKFKKNYGKTFKEDWDNLTNLTTDKKDYIKNAILNRYAAFDEAEELTEKNSYMRFSETFKNTFNTSFEELEVIDLDQKKFILSFLCNPFKSLNDLTGLQIEDTGYEILEDEQEYISSFIEYRWWNWRHWGKQRYSKVPKLCVHNSYESSMDIFYPYNIVKDAQKQNYLVFDSEEEALLHIEASKIVPIKLIDKEYRIIKEEDYEAYRYSRKEASRMSEEYYVLDADYNYYRNYKNGDGTIKIFDGHLGRWIQCYQFEKDENGNYVYENGLYVPYNEQIYGRRKRYKKIRNYEGKYIYIDGKYIDKEKYYNEQVKSFILDYRGLNVSFTDNYEYDASNFALSLDKANLKLGQNNNNGNYDNNKYLSFDFNKEPIGFFETTIAPKSVIEKEVKERWVYWVETVNNNFSLTDNLLSKIGMVFQKQKDFNNLNGNDVNYAFLGMQLFKYYPYIPAIDDDLIEEPKETLAIPGVSPSAKELTIKSYYIYDPLETIDIDSIKYKYVGQKPFEQFNYLYDENCQKIRSIKGKESNYFNLLQSICSSFECWVDFQIEHDEQTGQIKYREENIYIQNDFVPNSTGKYIQTIIEDDNGNLIKKFELITELPESNVVRYEKVDEPITYVKAVNYETIVNYINDLDVLSNEDYSFIEDEKGDYYYNDSEGQYLKIEEIYEGTRYTYKLNISEDNVIFRKRKAAQYLTKELNEIHPSLINTPIGNLLENNLITFEDYFYKEIMIVPNKKVVFKKYVGKENYGGFKYGVNLKNISRTLDSAQTASKIIVKMNNNKHAKDGFCTIQRASENPIGEDFAFNFDYYIRQGMLDKDIIWADLYTGVNSKLNYYNILSRLNKNNEEIITQISNLTIDLDKARADLQTAELGRDAAEEEIAKLAEILNSNYDTYGQLIDVPWTFNKSKQYTSKQSTKTEGYEKELVRYDEAGNAITYKVYVEEQTSILEYPKYNDQLRKYFDQMDTFQRNHILFSSKVEEFKLEVAKKERELNELLEQQNHIAEKKNSLNKLFYQKYSRYIQEGNWSNNDYIDDNLYYLDSLSVLNNSISPKVSYSIGVVDLANLEETKVLNFEVGDRTYIEDIEFFGYGSLGKPYQEQIVITEITYNLEDPSATAIKVQNYTTQFEDLFKKITAASQSLQYAGGSYGYSSSLFNDNGSINTDVLKNALKDSTEILAAAGNENVYWDNTGLTVTSFSNTAGVVKIISGGILVSSDGGNTYNTAITGDGINASLLKAGKINIDTIIIGASTTPNFLWDRYGITAFRKGPIGIDYSTFVRMDEYGFYGISNYSKNNIAPENMSINDVFQPGDNTDLINELASFGLTWDGFFLNTGTAQDKGRVKIGTGTDLRMSSYSSENGTWLDRVIIGKMKNVYTGKEYYGFRLVDTQGRINLDTDEDGELYLRKKLRIANFKEDNLIQAASDGTVELIGAVLEDEEKIRANEDRVTLGIVETYERVFKEKIENIIYSDFSLIDLQDSIGYSSRKYLTKIFSIKANEQVGLEAFNVNNINTLIKDNETFAIFDNGNLYAKNAWIEGRIDATSGSITGNMNITGILKLGSANRYIELNGIQGEIKTSDYVPGENGWRISPDMAEFENGKFRGTLLDTVVETVNVQSVGGALILAKTGTIKNIIQIEKIDDIIFAKVLLSGTDMFGKDFQLVLDQSIEEVNSEISIKENSENTENNNENSNIEISTVENIILLTEPYYCYNSRLEFNETNENLGKGKYRIIKKAYIEKYTTETGDKEDCTAIEIYLTEKDYQNLQKELSILLFKQPTGNKYDCGISLNTGFADQEINVPLDENGNSKYKTSLMKAKSIHIFDIDPTNLNSISTKVVLGQIPDEEEYGILRNKNGLYAENALIKGSIVLQNDKRFFGFSAEMNKQKLYFGKKKNGENDEVISCPVFWGISSGEENLFENAEERNWNSLFANSEYCKFWIDDNGTLFAKDAKIETASRGIDILLKDTDDWGIRMRVKQTSTQNDNEIAYFIAKPNVFEFSPETAIFYPRGYDFEDTAIEDFKYRTFRIFDVDYNQNELNGQTMTYIPDANGTFVYDDYNKNYKELTEEDKNIYRNYQKYSITTDTYAGIKKASIPFFEVYSKNNSNKINFTSSNIQYINEENGKELARTKIEFSKDFIKLISLEWVEERRVEKELLSVSQQETLINSSTLRCVQRLYYKEADSGTGVDLIVL